MRVRIQVILEDDDGHVLDSHDVFSFQRKHFQPEQVGLTLAEAKETLHGIQETIVHHQVEDFLKEQHTCPTCGQQRRQKGKHTLVYRTLFGSFQLPSPRFYRCQCQETGPRSFSPLAHVLAERTVPELLYLETKWAALIPYRASSELLMDVLPLDHAVSTAVLRSNVHKVRTGWKKNWERNDSCLLRQRTMKIPHCQTRVHRLPLAWTGLCPQL